MNSRRHPVRNLTAQLKKHHAFSRKNIPKITAFYLKLAIQEPFRVIEELKSTNIKKHEPEKDPIFIIGHWRSGTSFLQYLMSQDPQFGYMNKFQVVFPDIFLNSERFFKKLVNLVPDSLPLIQDAQNMSIDLDLDSPSEIEIALTTMISPTSLHWGHIFPNNAWDYFDKYLFFDTATETDINQWKRDYKYLIKKTSLKNDDKQLLIKSPGNASRIKKLLDLYPQARFIFIHRNPYDVFYSSKKLWNTLLDNLALQDFSKKQMEQEIIKVYNKLMKRYLEQRTDVPEEQIAEIRFQDFISNPMDQLHAVYQKLELQDFDKAVPHFRTFLESKTEGKSSNYEYENRIVKLINENWKFAFDQWDYSMIKNNKHANITY